MTCRCMVCFVVFGKKLASDFSCREKKINYKCVHTNNHQVLACTGHLAGDIMLLIIGMGFII